MVRDLIRGEREAFRADREQTDAVLRTEQSEVTTSQERLLVETENLRASMEQLQRRVEGQSDYAIRVEPFAGLRSVGDHHQSGNSLKMVSYNRGFSPRDCP